MTVVHHLNLLALLEVLKWFDLGLARHPASLPYQSRPLHVRGCGEDGKDGGGGEFHSN
jgi:hypothetical protein